MVYRDHRGVKNTVFRRRYRFCSSFERSSLSHARVLRRDLSLGALSVSGWVQKRVQGVVRTRKRLEAVSVMDVDLISHGHNEHIVRQEVHVGTLLSDLVTSGESVNFIETL